MDKMNLFDHKREHSETLFRGNDKSSKTSFGGNDNEKQETDNISKIELLVACYVESLPEDRQKCILNLANVLHNVGSNAIKQDIEVDTYTLLRNLKDFQNGFNKFLEEEVATVLKKAGLFESNNSKVINTSEAPIQNKYGLLHFRQVDVVSPSYNIKLDNDKVYSVDVYSEKSRNICIKQLKEDTGINFAWLYEVDAKKHFILYDPEMYQIDEEWNFSYRECSGLIPLMPLNGTSCRGMFSDLTNVTTIDFSHFYTNNVTVMTGMFLGSTKLKELNLSSFDTSNVVNMSGMFQLCESLTQVNLSSFNTYNVTDMSCMFDKCYNLHTLDLSKFNTSNVTDMSFMFRECKNLYTLDLYSFNTVSVKCFYKMFSGCENLHYIDVSYKWVINKCAKDDKIFDSCYKLPHYGDSRTGLEMFCSVNEGGYFHYIREKDDHFSPVIVL